MVVVLTRELDEKTEDVDVLTFYGTERAPFIPVRTLSSLLTYYRLR